ncbi:MAG: hypothetical protein OHK0029_08180 [Armatimonadaceae bacterium]
MFKEWKQWVRWWREQDDEVRLSAFPSDDPEMLLERAQQQMRAVHAQNRERAVQAITQKNNLQQMVDNLNTKIRRLTEEAQAAQAQGDSGRAEELRHSIAGFQETLAMTETQLAQAIETSESVKAWVRAEEERIRQKAAEAMALRAQWRLIQVERQLARDGQTMENAVPAGVAGVAGMDPEQIRLHLIEAMQLRDNLRGIVEEGAQKIAGLQIKADFARQKGNDELAFQYLREMEQAEANLEGTRRTLEQAEQTVQRLDAALRGEAVDFSEAELYIDFGGDEWEQEEYFARFRQFLRETTGEEPPADSATLAQQIGWIALGVFLLLLALLLVAVL